jgi:CrcB protein
MKQLILVFLGGGLGSALRYWIGQYLNSPKYDFPYGTFLVNIVGSLLIGLILGFTFKVHSLSDNFILFIAVGFCGGFTTFSAFAFDNLIYLKSGDLTSFAIYTIGTLLIGFGAVFVGIWLVRFF